MASRRNGLLSQLPDLQDMPAWLREMYLDTFAKAFEKKSFRGGLNYYCILIAIGRASRRWPGRGSCSSITIGRAEWKQISVAPRPINRAGHRWSGRESIWPARFVLTQPSTHRIVYVDQRCARRSSILKPAMIASIGSDELAEARAATPGIAEEI
jgi:hypothetical protein